MDPQRIGRYEVIRELGRGGMATVYLARDPSLGREVAIKVLPRQFIQDATFLERFRREARAVGRLNHEAVVAVYDSGEHEGQPYLVMEYMPGGTLTSRLTGRPMPLPQVIQILTPVAAAVDAAHRAGIVHRDLKPGNILFDAEGRPHVADFGIAQLGDATQSITGTGLLGTPAYMSPEQCQGDGEVTSASDIYSLGVIGYEMLTGHPPFIANSMPALLRKHIMDEPPRPSSVAPDLDGSADGALLRALAKEPERRFVSAMALVAGLPAVAAMTSTRAPVVVTEADVSETPAVQRTDSPNVDVPTRPVQQAATLPGPVHPSSRDAGPETMRFLRGMRPRGAILSVVALITVIFGGFALLSVLGDNDQRTPPATATTHPTSTPHLTTTPTSTPASLSATPKGTAPPEGTATSGSNGGSSVITPTLIPPTAIPTSTPTRIPASPTPAPTATPVPPTPTMTPPPPPTVTFTNVHWVKDTPSTTTLSFTVTWNADSPSPPFRIDAWPDSGGSPFGWSVVTMASRTGTVTVWIDACLVGPMELHTSTLSLRVMDSSYDTLVVETLAWPMDWTVPQDPAPCRYGKR